MIKKFTSLMLIGLILNLALFTTASAGNAEKAAKFALKVKSEISRLGTGTEANVKVKLRDNSKLSGYVSEIGAESFTVIDKQTNEAVQVPYSQVKKVKGRNNLTGKEILIGVGIGLFIIMIVAWVASDTGV